MRRIKKTQTQTNHQELKSWYSVVMTDLLFQYFGLCIQKKMKYIMGEKHPV